MRILVVDDEPDIRVTMRMLLELLGHTLDTACNGQRALEVAERAHPELILLDLNMPVMDGFVAAQRLRELPGTRDAMIVAVSAYVSQKEWCDRAIAAGVDECLSKPVDYDALDALLRRGRAPQDSPRN